MARSPSRNEKLGTPEDELEELQKRLTYLEGERKKVIENLNFTRKQNEETILQLQKEHKELRANLKASVKQPTSAGALPQSDETVEGVKMRRRLDQLKGSATEKQGQLKILQDKLKEMSQDQKGSMLNEDAPQMRQIRILENRLDKAMIKYNEAQSIRKTYEQIVKQLKEERVAYDNQLAAIERSLKGKEHDFEELLLLSHDAEHAKETSEAELCRFEAQITVERMTREKNVEEKKDEVTQRIEMTQKLEIAERKKAGKDEQESKGFMSRLSAGIANEAFHHQQAREEKQKIKDYEDAFRRIKESTGVTDVNEVIQKFMTQEDTAANLENLRNEHQKKLEQLNKQKQDLKRLVDSLKYSAVSETESRKHFDDLEEDVSKASVKYDKNKAKFQRLMSIITNVKAGIEHIFELVEGVKIEGQANIPVTDDNLIEALVQIKHKMISIYGQVKSTDVFKLFEKEGGLISKLTDTAQRNVSVLQAIYSNPQLSSSKGFLERGNANNCRVKTQAREEEELSDEGIDEELEDKLGDKDKAKREQLIRTEKLGKGLKGKRTQSAASRKMRNIE
ncbi:unnamed protein product [Blepharisma stoltei]|uniref:ODAD1 central coiled coil region domain-containing protein n=1 Tax=Blepharisma stoltei TaxID=1481888 RepID=A0AAU9K774_9CILI|nr:unnamed protein product [Blepharisma stoltei]